MENKPFIHLFKTPLGSYFYDVNRNAVLKINEAIYDYLDREQKGEDVSFDQLSEENKCIIQNLKVNHFLMPSKIKEVKHYATDNIEYFLNNRVEKITLQVTQQCNLRCRYCIYSEEGQEYQRSHSNKEMSLETAKKGIDFLIEHSGHSDRINIGFYGGEPLLRFDLIKECVEYAESKITGKELTFSMTTNGTLINEDILDFCQEHNLSITISLDGPKEIHNKNRRFAANGCGTYDIVNKNIEKIKDKYPDIHRNLLFSIVIDPENDFKCTNEFFLNYDLVCKNTVVSTIIDDKYSIVKSTYSENYVTSIEYENFKSYLVMTGEIDKKHQSNIMMFRVLNMYKTFSKMNCTEGIPEVCHHGGPCLPGVMRLFMNVNGDLFPCERVSESHDTTKIGDIIKGFDVEKIKKVLNIGKLTENKCKNCWAFSNCTQCLATCDNGKTLSAALKLSNCKNVKNNFESLLKDYSVLRELGCKFSVAL